MIKLSHDEIQASTQKWLENIVIGLNLCPFAKAVHRKKQIRYCICEATTVEDLYQTLITELNLLSESPAEKLDTTLLIHPYVLTRFTDYNNFLDAADQALLETNLEGVIQIASFHPEYQFAGTKSDDIENYTNRSPFPILHLLREASVQKAVEAFPQADEIFNKNIKTLRKLGRDGWDELNKK